MELAQQWFWEVAVKTDSETKAELFFLCSAVLGLSSKVGVKGRAEF